MWSKCSSNNLRTFCVTFCVIVTILFIVSLSVTMRLYHAAIKSETITDKFFKHVPGEIFKHVSSHGVKSYETVCVEPHSKPVSVERYEITFEETQKIVIYGVAKTTQMKRLSVPFYAGHSAPFYDVEFSNRTLQPDDDRLIGNTAFFITPKCPGNFHHFFKEVYFPLFSTMRTIEKLHDGAGNIIIYNTPNTDYETFCRNQSTYDDILHKTLFTTGFHDVYYNLPRNTCFANAVFGSHNDVRRPRDAVDNVIRGYNLTVCSEKANYTTIVSRPDRKILNIDELNTRVKNRLKTNVRMLDFVGVSVAEQLEIACTSQLFIGVNGAALEWGAFMPEGSHVIEIAWPTKGWSYFYRDRLPSFGIRHHAVEVSPSDVHANWTTYEIREQKGVKLSDAQRQEILKKPPYELWKWSDVIVRVEDVLDRVVEISNSPG